jgi:hypothetical protein
MTLCACALGLAGCGPRSSPEQQVRAVIAAGEEAAERRDHGDLMALVSPRYEGASGENVDDLSQLLRGYLLAHPSVHLATRIEQVEFPYDDLAKVRLTIGMLGRETDAASAAALDLAADVQKVELELQRDDGDWKVTRANWESEFAR